jgi:poly(3-hydroxybutyrate) depolymerase
MPRRVAVLAMLVALPPALAALDCNPRTGLEAPLPVCSATRPCTRPGKELRVKQITTTSDKPVCRTTERGRPKSDDGEPLHWKDPTGTDRYACLYQPAGASPAAPRPLVVWLHGGGKGLASDVYNFTSIRAKAERENLSGDPARPGFALLAVQGRNLHYPTHAARDGHHHDFYYRDLASPSQNPDIANLDRLIDALVASGTVDRQRIYLMGWSNGGFFGQLYAIARHARATPGGNRVAAAAVFSAADPFHNVHPGQTPTCQLDPYPKSTVPIMLVSRSCDVVACDRAQAGSLTNERFEVEPGHIAGDWIRDLGTKVGDANVVWSIVDGDGKTVSQCTAARQCRLGRSLLNHVRWPDGVADRSGIDHEPAMLDFLRRHARSDSNAVPPKP